ncbi:MerR family transcriptional regulator [Enterococcus sp. DIV0876]|uniref:MerR family transcriptional regulator n=1 Tax=Enterococcus sp. DIV0876 TaxID=2774633 RepID=UPI003D2FF8CC
MKTYSTSEVAKMVDLHPNTIRRYEEWNLIPEPLRKKNGYRIYNDFHVELIKTSRIAFQIEVLQSGLRESMRGIIKALANYKFDQARTLLDQYIVAVDQEIDRAEEAIHIVEYLLKGETKESSLSLKRREVAVYLGVTTDALRNWELNGLLTLKRNQNGYRIYKMEDLNRLKIIRTLRSAKYSLEAILRLLNFIDLSQVQDIRAVLNQPNPNEDIISACDSLIISLEKAKENTIGLKDNICQLQELSKMIERPTASH